MWACTACRPDSYNPWIQVNVIVYDYDTLSIYFIPLLQFQQAFPAVVHIGLRFCQHYLLTAYITFTQQGLMLQLINRYIMGLCQEIYNIKADIMPASVVFITRISQPAIIYITNFCPFSKFGFSQIKC